MNKNDFCKLNGRYGYKFLSDDYSNSLYDYYVTASNIYNFKIIITEEEFNNIINDIYEVLNGILTDEQIRVAFIQYIQLLTSDSMEEKKVDRKYLIKHLYYLYLDLLNTPYLKKSKKYIKKLKKNYKKGTG